MIINTFGDEPMSHERSCFAGSSSLNNTTVACLLHTALAGFWTGWFAVCIANDVEVFKLVEVPAQRLHLAVHLKIRDHASIERLDE